jgi:hypothetical protein
MESVIGEMKKKTYKLFVGKIRWKRLLGKSSYKWWVILQYTLQKYGVKIGYR